MKITPHLVGLFAPKLYHIISGAVNPFPTGLVGFRFAWSNCVMIASLQDKEMEMYPCTNCQTTKSEGQWWNLKGYFRINGRFCQACYAKVSHDSYGKPENPKAYLSILQKQEKPYA